MKSIMITPEEFVDSLEKVFEQQLMSWQKDMIISFLKMKKEDREKVLVPRRGDGFSTTRMILYSINELYNKKEKAYD